MNERKLAPTRGFFAEGINFTRKARTYTEPPGCRAGAGEIPSPSLCPLEASVRRFALLMGCSPPWFLWTFLGGLISFLGASGAATNLPRPSWLTSATLLHSVRPSSPAAKNLPAFPHGRRRPRKSLPATQMLSACQRLSRPRSAW